MVAGITLDHNALRVQNHGNHDHNVFPHPYPRIAEGGVPVNQTPCDQLHTTRENDRAPLVSKQPVFDIFLQALSRIFSGRGGAR